MSAVPQAAPPADRRTPALSAADGLRYGLLGLPLAFLSLPLYVMLPSHHAQQYGIALGTLGALLLFTRIADAAADPLIGVAVDRLFARSLRSVWRAAAAAAVATALGYCALFFPPVGGSSVLPWLAGWLLWTYLCFSLLTVVHQAWGVRLGGDAAHRARIVAWREGFGLLGVLSASVLPSVLGLPASAAWLAAGLALGVALLARAPRPATSSASARAPWHAPWTDPAFRRLLPVFMLNGIASAVPATLVLFFVRDRLQASASEPLFLASYFASAVLSIPLWTWLVGRIGLARSWAAGMLLAVASFAWSLSLGAGDAPAFFIVCLFSGATLGADLTVPSALLAGVVRRSGQAQGSST